MVEKMKKQVLRKEIKRKVVGVEGMIQKEIVENHYLEKDILTKEELKRLLGIITGLGENCFFGVALNDDFKIKYICIDRFLQYFQQYEKNISNDELTNQSKEIITGICNKLRVWDGFTLWV